ncbi:poly(ADP-ribose) glycohydrolase 1 isoform X2 [Cryptomeria japonica]|uniref:poly(ADP-ribose) glycohydrolase 1 isoform X2 n=1 Tax=Cryptomeria japonica TaxID=3369 RepID=UPI0027DA4D1D|nr:poly(ADP-ribose) glycohydrolase 1 isoform X2 [Cryptomeria japonica]
MTCRGRPSILPFLPLIIRGTSFFWPPGTQYALKTLSRGPSASFVDSGETLFDFIARIRQTIGLKQDGLCPFVDKGYALFFDDLISRGDSRRWFEQTLPWVARLLLQFPVILENHYKEANNNLSFSNEGSCDSSEEENSVINLDTSLHILQPQQAGIVLLSQELVAAILACNFFCLFPKAQRWKNQLPDINFDRLFAGLCTDGEKQEHKIKCIIHYFERICSEMPCGAVSFERKVLPFKDDNFSILYPKVNYWSESKVPLCTLKVMETGTIEDHEEEALEVDFANKYLGGGVLGHGCVQEEIRFLINPESIAGMLFLPAMQVNEAIEIVGAERFSEYHGEVNKAFCGFLDHAKIHRHFRSSKKQNVQGDSLATADFQECSNSIDNDLSTSVNQQLENGGPSLVNDEALDDISQQMSPGREKDGMQYIHSLPSEDKIGIATGNWGCGAFGGDVELKSILQWLAASQALRPFVLYYTFGEEFSKRLIMFAEWVTCHCWTVGELWDMLIEYSRLRSTGKTYDSFFNWVLPHLNGDTECKE